METYKVIRFFRKSSKRKIIMKGISLKIAQLHCRSPHTHKEGEWFDGYKKEKTIKI